MYICASCACLLPEILEEGIRSTGTGVTDGYKPLQGCWESNPGPLEEQSVVLTTEPFLQFKCLSLLQAIAMPFLSCLFLGITWKSTTSSFSFDRFPKHTFLTFWTQFVCNSPPHHEAARLSCG